MENEFITAKEAMMDEVYSAYHLDVYRVLLHLSQDEYLAQDIMQETFYEFFLHYDTVRQTCIKSYLIRSARNRYLNWCRDQGKEIQVDEIPERIILLDGMDGIHIRKEEREISRRTAHLIMESVKKENESWYEMLNLLYGLDKPVDVVAYELGITRETLYSRLYRAKNWIRKRFNIDYRSL